MTDTQRGLTLIDLLLSLVLSLGLILLLVQLHVQSRLLFQRQQLLTWQLEGSAALIQVMTHSIRDALYGNNMTAELPIDIDAAPLGSDNVCSGIVINGQCIAPVSSWLSGAEGIAAPATAESGSAVLQLKRRCCAEGLADQYYLARRGGLTSNPLSLYRRTLQTDGSFSAAVELIEEVAELSYKFIVRGVQGGELMWLDSGQVSDWWRLVAVRVLARVHDKELTFLVSSRSRQLFSELMESTTDDSDESGQAEELP